ncbi:MAG: LysM peptidoglycan-binding domain-containing protein [Deltaproteobacteria bacterium]|nr:LysM peptidoglycan-binding domain-containing protein [Deltaproteobacteria bacterium]MBW1929814.1 LysM peptidoglycan-binding domain-containing protein [Deltaproteobacteria bacterium]MBW2024461.1 LysM peptidoglycan-binding domain-containing protein [Deltaproteobacteria bacterium]MBW2127113.1 LysM peptidoglycan-binding domain-containing protein [Deltaproteobacteria bacterium]
MSKVKWCTYLLGLVVGICVVVLLGCVTPWQKQKAQPVVEQPAPAPAPQPAPAPPPPPKEVEKPQPQPEKKVEPPPLPPKPPYLEHVVRWSGETLSLIAKWYTGKFNNWGALAEANPEINPRRMRKGNIIRIPWELLTTEKPMPKSFVDRFAPKKRLEEEPVLFGPKK